MAFNAGFFLQQYGDKNSQIRYNHLLERETTTIVFSATVRPLKQVSLLHIITKVSYYKYNITDIRTLTISSSMYQLISEGGRE